MNKLVYLLLLAGGIVLIVCGARATESMRSSFSHFFTGSPTDKAIWLLIGGLVASVVAITGILRDSKT